MSNKIPLGLMLRLAQNAKNEGHADASENTSTPATRRRFFSAAIRLDHVRGDGWPKCRAMRKRQYRKRRRFDQGGRLGGGVVGTLSCDE